jgi:hypothetical protein
MRGIRAANSAGRIKPADRISNCAVLMASVSCGVLVFFVALPIARSSPYPTPRHGAWVLEKPATHLASQVPSSTAIETRPVIEAETIAANEAETMPQRAGFMLASVDTKAIARETATDADPEPLFTKSIATLRFVKPPADSLTIASAPSVAPAVAAPAATAAKKPLGPMDEVDDYLWEVYQRAPVKKDSTGDFSWKDPAAAKRVKMTLQTYVILGMDRDFREMLYHSGKAMDDAGIRWSMLSAFRDDYRQQIASGFKARAGNSLHGGSRATGGYGHGRAVDIVSADGDHSAVWRWVDRNGGRYGLSRPMPGADPAHIQPRGNWKGIAVALRDTRTRLADKNEAKAKVAAKPADSSSR